MKARFQIDRQTSKPPVRAATLVDPEAYDASEQQFSASLEEKRTHAKFEVAEAAELTVPGSKPPDELQTSEDPHHDSETDTASQQVPDTQPEQKPADSGDAWRQELQTKLSQYRAKKRPAPPRYPSLQLKFETSDSAWTSSVSALRPAIPVDTREVLPTPVSGTEEALQPEMSASPEQPVLAPPPVVGKLLEFPLIIEPPPARDELAEPVFEQPRIVEVPDIVPPPPALGGILIEAPEQLVEERRPGLDLPLQAAPMSKRLLASAADAFLVLLSVGVFAYIFSRIASGVVLSKPLLFAFAALAACFWTGYQYLLLVYAGTTPGLKFAKLRLSRFDGTSVPQRLRRWRVLAALLSGLSLALGYAWCFFDEDQLCWHDRITHTYIGPASASGPLDRPI
jgi:uncharacterized RDD family membrane protein YckC